MSRYLGGVFGVALVGVLLFPGNSMVASQEPEKKFFIPESLGGAAPSKEKPGPAIPIKQGEEVPDWVARWELARVLSYADKYDESIAEYLKLLKEKPDLSEARVELANVWFWKGNREKAIEILEKIPPKEVDEDSRLLMAEIYVAKKAYERAEPIYRAHLRKHPEDLRVRLKLAEMLSWVKKYDASLEEYQKILKKRPEDIQVRRRYAFVLIWAGRHEKAARELKKTLD